MMLCHIWGEVTKVMSYDYASFFLNDVLLVRATVRNSVSIPNFERDLVRKREIE